MKVEMRCKYGIGEHVSISDRVLSQHWDGSSEWTRGLDIMILGY